VIENLVVDANNFLIGLTAITMVILSFTGIKHMCVMKRIGFTVMTGGMVWLAYDHSIYGLIPCTPCLMVLFGIHIVAISMLVGWAADILRGKKLRQFFTEE
jgi:apolipoprotein N-acyltransferase